MLCSPFTAATDMPHSDVSKISKRAAQCTQMAEGTGEWALPGPFHFPCKASKSWDQGDPQPAMLTVLPFLTALPSAGQIRRRKKDAIGGLIVQLARRKASVGGEGKSKRTGRSRLICPSALPFLAFSSVCFSPFPLGLTMCMKP